MGRVFRFSEEKPSPEVAIALGYFSRWLEKSLPSNRSNLTEKGSTPVRMPVAVQ